MKDLAWTRGKADMLTIYTAEDSDRQYAIRQSYDSDAWELIIDGLFRAEGKTAKELKAYAIEYRKIN